MGSLADGLAIQHARRVLFFTRVPGITDRERPFSDWAILLDVSLLSECD